jgi:hypothetical protein
MPANSWAYKAFAALLRREWFTRVWIIQELAVSKEPKVMCGDFRFSWDMLFNAVEQAYEMTLPIWDNSKKIQRMYELAGMRLTIREGQMQPLLSLLLLAREFKSTDPRDKVYALCGLANDCGSNGFNIRPEYDISVEELYKKVAHQLLFRTTMFSVLPGLRRLRHPSIFQHGSQIGRRATGQYRCAFRETPSTFKRALETSRTVP